MKKLLLRLFLHDKFIGQIAAAAAAALAAWVMTVIPGSDSLVATLVGTLLQLDEGTELSTAGLTAALTPLLLAVINAVLQEFVVRDNNKALDVLQDTGLYPGAKDGWVGPLAKRAIEILAGK